MPWSHLPFNWQPDGLREFELPAAQIVGDLARHEQVVEAAVGWRSASASPARPRSTEKAALVRVRRDQTTLSDAERQAFKNGVQRLVDEGIYDALVSLRGDLTHNMFGSLGVNGLHRFLPWHRRYLWEFETHFERADRCLRPNERPLALPYWNWSDPFPDWLADCLPAGDTAAMTTGEPQRNGDASVGGVSVEHVDRARAARSLCGPASKPTPADIQFVLHGFAEQLPAAQRQRFRQIHLRPGRVGQPARWQSAAGPQSGPRLGGGRDGAPPLRSRRSDLLAAHGPSRPAVESLAKRALRRTGAGRARSGARSLARNCRRDAQPARARLCLRSLSRGDARRRCVLRTVPIRRG